MFMHWCVSIRNCGKIIEYSEMLSVFLTVMKLEISEVSEFLILAHEVKSKARKTQNFFSRLVKFKEFALFEKAANSWCFQVFNFGPYTEIENSEISEIFSRLVNFKGVVLFEKVADFRGFRVFDFCSYTKIQYSKKSKIFSRLPSFKEFG